MAPICEKFVSIQMLVLQAFVSMRSCLLHAYGNTSMRLAQKGFVTEQCLPAEYPLWKICSRGYRCSILWVARWAVASVGSGPQPKTLLGMAAKYLFLTNVAQCSVEPEDL